MQSGHLRRMPSRKFMSAQNSPTAMATPARRNHRCSPNSSPPSANPITKGTVANMTNTSRDAIRNLRKASDDVSLCIFLCEVGCQLQIHGYSRMHGRKSVEKIRFNN